MSKRPPPRPSFAATALADLAGTFAPAPDPDQALWPNAGSIRPAQAEGAPRPDPAPPAAGKGAKNLYRKDHLDKKDSLYNKDHLDEKDARIEKIVFSNKLEARTYLKLQQLATYGGENIQQVLESALAAYFEGKEEATRPLPPKALAGLRRKYPFL